MLLNFVCMLFFGKPPGDNLSWGAGHYKSSNINSYQPKLGFNDLDFPGDTSDGDVTDSEWFYFYSVSLTQSFIADNNILGRAFLSGGFVWLAGDHEFQFYESERVKESRIHGIQSLVCVATLSGVLELASLDVIQQDWGLVHLTKSLFRSDDDDHNRLSNQQATREANVLVPPLKNGRFLGAQEELTTQDVVEVDVKIIGSSEAMIRVQCPDLNYPYARLMNALKWLGLQVSHASISSVNELMIQNVVIRLPCEFASGKALRLVIKKRWHT